MMQMASFKAQLLWDNILRQDLSAVHSMLESGQVNLEERDANGCTFLMVASEQGALSIVRELLQAGVDPNAVDNENWNALLCASKEGHLEIVMELLDRSVDLEHADMCGWTPLMWSCYRGHTLVVNELLEQGANPNVKADHHMTCMAWAAGRGYVDIVKSLIDKGAKVNMPDKYGTTPLIWACRKGHVAIVDILFGEGANKDASGMNSWTPLLISTKNGHFDIVKSVLNQEPNVNATDKDGLTALAIAAREGYFEVVNELLAKGAYVNIQDRNGDSILIHAVKGGHVDIVKVLLKKFADVDVEGQDSKTALYFAVEKGYTDIVRLLLQNNPDLERSTKDEDTALLRAVRMKKEECVWLLLEKGAKVSASDKRGDTALHIAIRARNKRITELLLRNPRHSRLLYRLNKDGESPYSMDTYHQKGILPQIYGHGNLNATDAENLLGYEIYSSALADILSEPSLITPITMGLYAKWGSGKSFLLDKLRGEMKSFSQQNCLDELRWTWLTAFLLLLLCVVVGEALGLAINWLVGLCTGLVLLIVMYSFIGVMVRLTQRHDFSWSNRLSFALGRKQKLLTLFFKMLFCVPRQRVTSEKQAGSPFFVRFLFSECTRLTSVGGEKSLAAMIGTLCDAVEKEYGVTITRLFRVFKTPPSKSNRSRGFFKSLCCIPLFLIMLLLLACVLVGIGLLIKGNLREDMAIKVTLIAMAIFVGLAVVYSIFFIWPKVIMAFAFSQKKRVTNAAKNIEDLRMDGFMQHLKREVDLLSKLVNCMDNFTQDQTRLVVIVDGLDSCEQNKVLQVLDTVKSLFSDDGAPFITILAVDPHIIIKGIEQNLKSSFQDTNVNGFDYLRNVVHLPFYLQSQGIRIQRHPDPPNSHSADFDLSPHKTQRQDSGHGSTSSDSRHGRKGSKAVATSTAHLAGGEGGGRATSLSGSLPGMIYASSFDLTSSLAKNDYFSDINPRSMRRLMNIVAVTARLLRAYNVDFKWHRLAAWINLTEQWPYRLSWIIYLFEEAEFIEHSASLYSLYKKIAPSIPASKDQDPLLEIDRNVRKLEASLTSKSGNFPLLNVGDLRKFLPCTINLDPYLRKLIRETQHNLERHQAEIATLGGVFPPPLPPQASSGNLIRDPSASTPEGMFKSGLGAAPQSRLLPPAGLAQPSYLYGMYGAPGAMNPLAAAAAAMQNPQLLPSLLQAQQVMFAQQQQQQQQQPQQQQGVLPAKHPKSYFNNYKNSMDLSQMSVSDLCDLLAELKGLSPNLLATYQGRVRDNNVSGLVLTMCDLADLRPVLDMKFGDWQLFRSAVASLLEHDGNAEQEQQDTTPDTPKDRKGTDFNNITSTSGTDTSFLIPSSSRPAVVPGPYTRSISLQEGRGFTSRAGGVGVVGEASEIPKTELQKIRQRRMQRNDSIVQQLSYETAILKSAVSGFVEEESEEDEESEGEDEVVDVKDDVLDASGGIESRPAVTHAEVHSSGKRASIDSSYEMDQRKPLFYVGSNVGSPEAQDSIKSPTMSLQSQFSYDQFTNDSQAQSSDQEHLLHSIRESSSSSNVIGATNDSATKLKVTDLARKPMSLSDITPFIQVLDGPAQSSTEFVPQLGSIQHCLGPSASSVGSGEFIPTSTDLTPLVNTSTSSWTSGNQVTSQSMSGLETQSSQVSFSAENPSSSFLLHQSAHPQPSGHPGRSPFPTNDSTVARIDTPNVQVFQGQGADNSDSESITETSPPQHKPFHALSSSIEWLSRPLTNLRHHFHSGGHEHHPHHHHLLNESSAPGSAQQHEDLVQQSYSTIVEMSAAATSDANDEGTGNFHHRLGVAFAKVDDLPGSEDSSPDRETNV